MQREGHSRHGNSVSRGTGGVSRWAERTDLAQLCPLPQKVALAGQVAGRERRCALQGFRVLARPRRSLPLSVSSFSERAELPASGRREACVYCQSICPNVRTEPDAPTGRRTAGDDGEGGGAGEPGLGSSVCFLLWVPFLAFSFMLASHLLILLPETPWALRMGGGRREFRERGRRLSAGWMISMWGQFQLVSLSCEVMHVIICDVINMKRATYLCKCVVCC